MIDRTEIIELAKQHGAIDSYPGSNDGIVEFANHGRKLTGVHQ